MRKFRAGYGSDQMSFIRRPVSLKPFVSTPAILFGWRQGYGVRLGSSLAGAVLPLGL